MTDSVLDIPVKRIDGSDTTLADYRGKVVVLFFGYTQCPDVCPTTLFEVSEILRALGPDADKMRALFITVDPERDTPQVLKAYMANFGADFIASLIARLPSASARAAAAA